MTMSAPIAASTTPGDPPAVISRTSARGAACARA